LRVKWKSGARDASRFALEAGRAFQQKRPKGGRFLSNCFESSTLI
jgi:hypothetical protein